MIELPTRAWLPRSPLWRGTALAAAATLLSVGVLGARRSATKARMKRSPAGRWRDVPELDAKVEAVRAQLSRHDRWLLVFELRSPA